MFGAWIGDIIGHNHAFCSEKNDGFPVFREDSHLSDIGIMTTAIASAIMKSRVEQFEHSKGGKSFRDFVMEETKPYAGMDRGVKIAAYVSPCGIAAVSLKEAVCMARICADLFHEDMNAVRDAEAVAGIVFLTKMKKKEEIWSFYMEKYSDLNAEKNYAARAMTCLLETDRFDAAIQRSLLYDCDCLGGVAVTGAIVWSYYCEQNLEMKPDIRMQQISNRIEGFIPEEFRETEKAFRDVAAQRAGTYFRTGFCTPIMRVDEEKAYLQKEKEEVQKNQHPEMRNTMLPTDDMFFAVPVKERKQSGKANKQSADGRKEQNDGNQSLGWITVVDAVDFLEKNENEYIVRDAMTVNLPRRGIMYFRILFEKITDENQRYEQKEGYTIQSAIQLMKNSWDFQTGSKILWKKVAPGRIETKIEKYKHAHLVEKFPRHTIWEARVLPARSFKKSVGSKRAFHDQSMEKTRMIIQLDQGRYWFLSIFFDSKNGKLMNYSLDYEGASDAHYEFKDEESVRKAVYQAEDEIRYIDEIFIRFLKNHTGVQLKNRILPFITAQFHYD